MKRVSAIIASLGLYALVLSINIAHAQTQASNADETLRPQARSTEFRFSPLVAQANPAKKAGFSFVSAGRYSGPAGSAFTITPMATGPLPVTGNGTLGRLTKWSGFTSSNSAIENSTIYEDKFGLVGIGTEAPTSRLTVMD